MRLGGAEVHDTERDSMSLLPDFMDDEAPSERRRPWFLIAASLLLATLGVVLWSKWSETRTETSELRAEIKQVYVEAESLRTQAAQAQQRVGLLEQQVRAL